MSSKAADRIIHEIYEIPPRISFLLVEELLCCSYDSLVQQIHFEIELHQGSFLNIVSRGLRDFGELQRVAELPNQGQNESRATPNEELSELG
jgi:hypothetical protein